MLQLTLMRLRFGLEVLAEAQVPAHKGDLLRTALLWHLGSIWCRHPQRCRNGCVAPDDCLFGQLIEPALDLASRPHDMRFMMGSTPPPAYVLWDEQDRRTRLNAGDLFHFELTLIGSLAVSQWPAFVAAILAAGEQGMGSERLHARLHQVDALIGEQGHPYPLLTEGKWVADPQRELICLYADGQTWTERIAGTDGASINTLSLRLLSPLNIKMRGSMTTEPNFSAIARAVMRRLRILALVHGGGDWPSEEYGPLLDLAEQVQLERHETNWLHRERHSHRGGTMPMEGITGQAWYTSPIDLRPLLPALWLGQWVHIGKAAVWGHGRYALASPTP